MSEPTRLAVLHCPHCGTEWSEVAVVRNADRLARRDTLAKVRAAVEGLPDLYQNDLLAILDEMAR